MIDRAARDNLAERLRKLGSGAITNFEFERRARRARNDPAVHEIAECLAWRCYDDLREHRLSGEYALSDGLRKDFARAVLFLKGNCEFHWPRRSGLPAWGTYLRCLFRLGRPRLLAAGGDARFWPFRSRDEYRAALADPPYLRGG
jgi:hypothetical protein